MNRPKTIHVIHAMDAQQHLGHLKDVLDDLKKEVRINDYGTTTSSMVDQSSLDDLLEHSMIVVLLTHGLISTRAVVSNILNQVRASRPQVRIVQILVDEMPFDSQFEILPVDQQAIRVHKDMDAEWFAIGRDLKDYFPIPEKPPIESTALKRYRPYILMVFAIVLVFFYFNNLKPRLPENVTLENFTEKFEFDDREIGWLKTASEAKAKLVALYNGNESIETKEFTERAVEVLTKGGSVDLEEAYIETVTNDTEYKISDERELLLPLRVVLATRDTVRIDYGTTISDGKHANQPVSVLLIDGIKKALETANKNLTAANKIKSIHIMATTNGKHGPNSNHYHKTAADINRINNKRMILTGLTIQIKQLQKAMDSYDYVRENFGPAMKHKFTLENNSWNLDYQVGGHTDHIHFSVRK